MSLDAIHGTAAAAMAGAEPAGAAFSGLPPEGVAAAAGSSVGRTDGQPAHVSLDAVRGGTGGDAPGAAGRPVGQLLLSPAVTVGARVVMGVAMAFMLLILI